MSFLLLEDVGIANNSAYVDITVYNGCVLVAPNWDINLDHDCNILDLIQISNHFDETGDPGWIREDVDNNGVIQILDFVFVSNHYNESWWV